MKDANLNIVRTKGTGNRFCFVAQVTADPFTNKDLRLALKYGIDREAIIKQVYNGYAVPGNDHTLDALNPYYNTAMPQRVFDPEKAAFHFKKAGLAAGTQIELQTSEGAWGTAVDCASIYQESMKKAGIDLTVNKVSADGYWDNVWPKVPFCAVYWGRRLSADAAFSQIYGVGADGARQLGTTQNGSMPTSRNWWSKPALNWMRPSARKCMAKRRNSSLKMAA